MTTRKQAALAAENVVPTNNHATIKPSYLNSKTTRGLTLPPPLTRKHLALALFIRLALVAVGELVDRYSHVAYTDVDYHVFSDAARYVQKGYSPYHRDTYRYSPLIAYFCLPNLYIHPVFGKILFSLVDIGTSVIVYKIAALYSTPKLATASSLLCLYNPVSLIISSRGNADSMTCLLVLLTLYYRLYNRSLLTGALLGLSIHCRMYPLIFSLPLFLSYRTNKDKLRLVLSTVLTLGVLTGGFYYLYGEKFVSESYLYHLSRTDVKHNYSVHFLSQYLGVSHFMLKFVPLFILQVLCSVRLFSLNQLPLCMFLQTYIFVTFAPVLTCQYFMWYFSLLIPILPALINIKQIAVRFVLWALVQLLWLVPAYYLEFKGLDMFLYVGVMCGAFFLINVNIMVKLIQFYKPLNKVY
uniref:GPI alpha-1,4-mannosyltransferase I, catalytic subunit n=1 Tax=Cacopsylla melanoneura TaxID=428564 RepID=A0A8D8XE70_9HEMI